MEFGTKAVPAKSSTSFTAQEFVFQTPLNRESVKGEKWSKGSGKKGDIGFLHFYIF